MAQHRQLDPGLLRHCSGVYRAHVAAPQVRGLLLKIHGFCTWIVVLASTITSVSNYTDRHRMGKGRAPAMPRAYEDKAYQWSFQRIPPALPTGAANPARDSAVFVVHGMGEQAYADTAVQLRNGFEDAIDEIQRKQNMRDVPTPYILDGYWANYDDFEHTFPEEWVKLARGEQTFFSKLWAKRTHSAIRAFFWFAWQALRLIADPVVWKNKEVDWVRRMIHLGIALLAWVADVFMLVRHRKILRDVLGDVRLYARPQGVVERTIVQRIDRRVGEKFLLLLGLDWEFRTLPRDKQLRIAGQPHRFRYVAWVAHSLGSVVSYNVISDLLGRCQQLRALAGKAPAELTPAEAQLLQNPDLQENIGLVEQGLHRFITIGSPLEKFALLFPEVLRPWPDACKRRLSEERRRWWVNFFHVWDPVSGRLVDKSFFPRVENLHSKLWRVPLLAHTSYWVDPPILTFIVTRIYGKSILPLDQPPTFLPEQRVLAYRILTLIVVLVLLIGTFYFGLKFAVGKLMFALSHPKTVLRSGWVLLKKWLGL